MKRGNKETDLAAYRTLVYRVLAARSKKAQAGFALCVTSVHGGAGVTFVSQQLRDALQESYGGRVQQVSFATLQASDKGNDPISRAEAELSQLLHENDIVLLDCPSLRTGGEAFAMAPCVDGVLLVVQAERTTKNEIMAAEQGIHNAGGVLFGFVLNRIKKPFRLWPSRS